jgi:glutathione peroxidase
MTKILIASLFVLSSIYSVSYTDINGASQSFNAFQGKKILIVNIATGSDKISQIGRLEQLYQQYQDSLVIIAFPSNSFGNEPRTDVEIKQKCETVFNTSFVLAQKASVTGLNAAPIYQWLANQSQNGVTNAAVTQDFQKFLINKDGMLIGIFKADVDPMAAAIRNAIEEEE